jgi:hypothetical protein
MCRRLKVCPVFRNVGVNVLSETLRQFALSGPQEQTMKAFISIDMEEICGVVREIETDPTKGGEAPQQSNSCLTARIAGRAGAPWAHLSSMRSRNG